MTAVTAAKRLLLAAASCWAALPAWADEPPETPAASASEPEPGASAPPAPTPPPPPPDTELDLLYLGPGALGDGWTSINVIVSLFAYFERNAGTTWVSSSGVGVLTDERRLLFTEDLADGPALTRFLTDPGELSAEVVEDALPVLDSPFEVNFQVPWQGHFDWVGKALDESTGGDFPDVRQVTGRLIRLENQRGEAVLSLELPGAAGHTRKRAFRGHWACDRGSGGS